MIFRFIRPKKNAKSLQSPAEQAREPLTRTVHLEQIRGIVQKKKQKKRQRPKRNKKRRFEKQSFQRFKKNMILSSIILPLKVWSNHRR